MKTHFALKPKPQQQNQTSHKHLLFFMFIVNSRIIKFIIVKTSDQFHLFHNKIEKPYKFPYKMDQRVQNYRILKRLSYCTIFIRRKLRIP
ncbi:unnamed protein product [Paramecium sonneborni]|uniref:Uncharacterized protein n=1 Tax=Paramecium sonneborni TaxID=65129 RepID=A0A8S1PK43_9CILI|nr:unnamed protein product [Paramecium sonneborni]